MLACAAPSAGSSRNRDECALAQLRKIKDGAHERPIKAGFLVLPTVPLASQIGARVGRTRQHPVLGGGPHAAYLSGAAAGARGRGVQINLVSAEFHEHRAPA